MMVSFLNVATGAMLGTILATSPAFDVKRLSDLSVAAFFAILLVLQGWNTWAASAAAANRRSHLAVYAIMLFATVQLIVFVSFTIDMAASSAASEGLTFVFTGRGYAWNYLLITSIWFVSNVSASWITGNIT